MKDIKIILNKNKLEIFTPPWKGSTCNSMPSRRWNKNKKVWSVPIIRANVEYIRNNMIGATISCDAEKAMGKISDIPNTHDGLFPEWYSFKTNPFKHQMEALRKTYPIPNSALFMGCGTGKTKAVIDIACARVLEGKIEAVVVICPYSIRSVWAKEAAIHCPLEYITNILGFSTKTQRATFSEFMAAGDCVKWLIVGVESMGAGGAKEWVEKFMLAHKCMMVIDESSRIKNPNANRTERCVELGMMANYKIIATGTPVTQGVLDLYSQFEFLDPEIIGMGDFYSFRNTYAIMGGYAGKEIIGYQNIERLMSDIFPYIYQITTEEALPNLPPKVYQSRVVAMTKQQKLLYTDISKKMMIPDGNNTPLIVKTILEKMMRLQQVAGGFYPVKEYDHFNDKEVTVAVPIDGRNPKVDELMLMLEDITDASVIVWCKFVSEIKAVSKALANKYGGNQVVEFYGGVDYNVRTENIDKFESKKARFFVGNASTGGIGVTLVAATWVVYFSNSFSYEDRVQSEARAHRSGQEHTVVYVDILCEGSVDTRVAAVLEDKGNVADYVRNAIATSAMDATI